MTLKNLYKFDNHWLSALATAAGPATGPFLFKAAGIADFPKFNFSHFTIIFCFAIGASLISNFLYFHTSSVIKKLIRDKHNFKNDK